ncbi:MAG: OmpP1/FadL family transporter [Desulfovibrio sp.]
MKKVILSLCVFLGMWALTFLMIVPHQADASGFALYEYDNRANGMGGAVIATQDPNASTVAYNPAAMTRIEGTSVLFGATLIAPSADVNIRGGDHVTTKGKVYAVPHAYGTFQINDWLWFGVGEFSRFGLGTNYDHDWQGAGNMYKASVETFSVNPNLAAKITDDLSVAVGVEYIYGKMDLRRDNRKIAPAFNEWKLFPEGDAWTWDAAVHYAPTDWLSFGATYRDWYEFVGKGDGEFTNSAADDEITMKANFPGMLSLGVAVKPLDNLTVEFDYIWTEWSSLKSMVYEFSDKTVAGLNPLEASSHITSPKHYSDTSRIQLGVEWLVQENMALRMGYVFDESPQNPEYADYMLPSNDRQIISSGFGYSWGNWTTDLSLMYLWASDKEIDNDVAGVSATDITNCTTWLGGLSVGYKF